MEGARRRLGILQHHLAASFGSHDAAGRAALALGLCRAAAAAAAGPPVLVGGAVMDLQAHPSGPADVQRGGSVPGRVTQSPGGVARNVAEALALLLQKAGGAGSSPQLPLLVSVVGDDLAGRALLQHWRELGLSTACIAQIAGGATPTVSVVFDLGGEVAACVADVGLLEKALLPPLLRQPRVAQALAAAPVLMLDGNLAEAALEEACRQAAAAGVPVWFEPVSVPKSVRATRLLSLLDYVSPNERELAAMAAAARQQEQQRQQQQQQRVGGAGSSDEQRHGSAPATHTAAAAALPAAATAETSPSVAHPCRTRRHRAAITICSLLYADACPPLRAPERAAQALALGVRAAREQETFARDQQRLAELQVTDPSHSDQLVLRRLAVAREDAIRAVDAREAVKAAAAKVASWMGEEQLQQRMQQADPTAAEQLQRLRSGQPMLGGGGGGGSTDNGSSDLNGGDGMLLRPGSSSG